MNIRFFKPSVSGNCCCYAREGCFSIRFCFVDFVSFVASSLLTVYLNFIFDFKSCQNIVKIFSIQKIFSKNRLKPGTYTCIS